MDAEGPTKPDGVSASAHQITSRSGPPGGHPVKLTAQNTFKSPAHRKAKLCVSWPVAGSYLEASVPQQIPHIGLYFWMACLSLRTCTGTTSDQTSNHETRGMGLNKCFEPEDPSNVSWKSGTAPTRNGASGLGQRSPQLLNTINHASQTNYRVTPRSYQFYQPHG